MVELEDSSVDTVFAALSDGTRRHMLRDLAVRERTIGELAEPHAMTLAAASKHIKVLEKAGLIRREVRWRTHWCSLEAAPLAAAYREIGFYAQFWTDRLDDLDRLLRAEDAASRDDNRT